MTKMRFNLLLDAQSFIQGKENVKQFYADINCNVKIRFSDNNEKVFSSMGEMYVSKIIIIILFILYFLEVIFS